MKLPGWAIYVFLLVPVWCVASGSIRPSNLVMGALVALMTVPIASRLLDLRGRGEHPLRFLKRLGRFVGYSVTSFLPEALSSSLDMASRVVRPAIPMRPGIVAVEISARSDLTVLFIINHIILTPGQLVVEIDEERSMVYVHSIDVGDVEELRRRLRALFKRAEEVLE